MEVEIEPRIKNFWVSHDRLMPETILNNVEGIWKDFQDATLENLVNVDEFLSALSLDFLQERLKVYLSQQSVVLKSRSSDN